MGKPAGGDTFVQADSACFRDLVQRLTGPSGNQPPLKSPPPKPKQKLHERRKPKMDIQFQPFLHAKVPPIVHAGSPNGGRWSCPTSPSSMLLMSPFSSSSPASPAGSSNKRASPSAMELAEEDVQEKAIKEKRFYLHPSPRSRQRLATEPELLTLFPLKSPTS